MIHINLLPEEMRRFRRVSGRTMLLMFAASVLAFGSLGTLGTLFFKVRSDRKAAVEIVAEQLDNLQPQAQYADKLTAEKAEFEQRSATIHEIASSRLLWTPKLDRLAEVVNRDVTEARHQVWLTQCNIEARRDKGNAGIQIKGMASGNRIESASNFHRDIVSEPVINEHFASWDPPRSSVDKADDDRRPPEKVSFEFAGKLPVLSKKKPAKRQAPTPEQK